MKTLLADLLPLARQDPSVTRRVRLLSSALCFSAGSQVSMPLSGDLFRRAVTTAKFVYQFQGVINRDTSCKVT